jgi:hypothetical protein
MGREKPGISPPGVVPEVGCGVLITPFPFLSSFSPCDYHARLYGAHVSPFVLVQLG